MAGTYLDIKASPFLALLPLLVDFPGCFDMFNFFSFIKSTSKFDSDFNRGALDKGVGKV